VNLHLGPDVTTCQVCGKTLALINIDKARGIVGLTMGWVHVSRYGRIKRRNHLPVPPEGL
jgi:hypothetical protein